MQLSQQALLWIAFAISILGFAGQWIDPANKKTPWNWSAPSRVTAFAIVSGVVGLLQKVSEDSETHTVPWTQSLLVALLTFGPAMLGHLAHHALPEPAGVGSKRGFIDRAALAPLGFIGFALVLAACAAFWTPAREHAVESFATCVLVSEVELVVEGDPSPAQEAAIAAKCGGDPEEVHDFVVGHPERLQELRVAMQKAGCAR